jgi:hypothetical protein
MYAYICEVISSLQIFRPNLSLSPSCMERLHRSRVKCQSRSHRRALSHCANTVVSYGSCLQPLFVVNTVEQMQYTIRVSFHCQGLPSATSAPVFVHQRVHIAIDGRDLVCLLYASVNSEGCRHRQPMSWRYQTRALVAWSAEQYYLDAYLPRKTQHA